MIEGIDHIGVAVNNLDEALAVYEKALGLKHQKVTVVDSQKVKVAFLEVGDSRIELLEPLSKDSTLGIFLEKRGEGIHHIALKVVGIDDMLKRLKNQGITLIDETPRSGAEGGKIAFLHPKSIKGVLLELREK
ncbi:MAG TPA: methylmalonyl-CoA epimerase [Candidatus Bathyarchaeia archaeon]|nr:methylmalonyl-CoA epimerase [Candidatus Bathyarchaeia archaeon]